MHERQRRKKSTGIMCRASSCSVEHTPKPTKEKKGEKVWSSFFFFRSVAVNLLALLCSLLLHRQCRDNLHHLRRVHLWAQSY